MKLFLVSVLSAIFFNSTIAFALPINQKLDFSHTLNSFDTTQSYNYDGIVKLNNCSGALVRFETSNDNDMAMVMTNGHCVPMPSGFIQPNQFVLNTPAVRTFVFLKNNGSLSFNSVKSTKILYATMTGTDLALYETAMTYADIKSKFNVSAITIESSKANIGESINILSGYWQRAYSCQIDTFVFNIQEAGYTWSDSIRYSQAGCKTIHGTSGSPIISATTGKIIGINNTGNDDGEKCTMNNPCEVSEDGSIYVEKDRSYGQQTYWIYSCLNAQNQFDLNQTGCKLFH